MVGPDLTTRFRERGEGGEWSIRIAPCSVAESGIRLKVRRANALLCNFAKEFAVAWAGMERMEGGLGCVNRLG